MDIQSITNTPVVLVVTQNSSILMMLQYASVSDGYYVFNAPSTHSAILQSSVIHPDLILVDEQICHNLDEFLTDIRQKTSAPIITLSSRGLERMPVVSTRVDTEVTENNIIDDLIAKIQALFGTNKPAIRVL